MDKQRSKSLHMDEALDTEYKYITQIRAFETFRNLVRREGISIPETSGSHVSFASSKRFDMKGYKQRGLIWSYSIIRVRKLEDVVEEG